MRNCASLAIANAISGLVVVAANVSDLIRC